MANFAESAVRDVFLYAKFVEPAPVVIIHTMAESLTDKLIDIYTSDSRTEIVVQEPIDKTKHHVLIAGRTKEQTDEVAAELFESKAKGIHHFHRSVFTGTLVEATYAPKGEKIWLRLPEGLYDGAKCTLMWRWTTDAAGVKNRPEHVYGRLSMVNGNPTQFKLATRKGYYDFRGSVTGKDTIEAIVTDKGVDISTIRLTRQQSSA